jgi:hypothetical protein
MLLSLISFNESVFSAGFFLPSLVLENINILLLNVSNNGETQKHSVRP